MPIQLPRSEFEDFDHRALSAGVLGEYQRILGDEYSGMMDVPNPDAVEEIQAKEIGGLVTKANAVLEDNGLIGVDGIFAPGAMIPYFQGIEPYRKRSDEPVLGKYYGYGLARQSYVDQDNETSGIVLSRPRIVHRLLLVSKKSVELDHYLDMQLYATLPIEDSMSVELMSQNNPAKLPNGRWLNSIIRQVREPATGDLDFERMSAAFDRIANAYRSKMPVHVNVDWFIDKLNGETQVDGAQIVAYGNQLMFYRQGQVPQYVTTPEDAGPAMVSGLCRGFGIMDELKQVQQNGKPVTLQIEGSPKLALIIEADTQDDGLLIVKLPVKSLLSIGPAKPVNEVE